MKPFSIAFLPMMALLLPGAATAGTDAETLLRNMKPAWKKVSDFSMEMKQYERLTLDGAKINEQLTYLKFAKPFRVYAKFIDGPYKGREALYQGKDWNNGQIMVSLEKFPRVTTSVSPFSKAALDNKHHPITHVGFEYLINTALAQVDKAKENGELDLEITGNAVIDGRSCTKVRIRLNAISGQQITGRRGQSWMDLGKEYNIDPYVIEYNNPKKSPANPKHTLWVPTYYGSRMEACIDDATNLPLKVSTWDHDGNLYEEYTFTKLKINIGLSDIDFDPKNAEYSFRDGF